MAIAPKMRHLALGLDKLNKVEIWDPNTKRLLHTLDHRSPSGTIMAVAYSADGRYLISLSGFYTQLVEVILWDTKDYRQLASVSPHDSSTAVLAFFPDGKRFVTAANSIEGFKVWRIESRMVDSPE